MIWDSLEEYTGTQHAPRERVALSFSTKKDQIYIGSKLWNLVQHKDRWGVKFCQNTQTIALFRSPNNGFHVSKSGKQLRMFVKGFANHYKLESGTYKAVSYEIVDDYIVCKLEKAK